MERLKRRLVHIAVAIVLLLLIGATGFMAIEHLPLFDAFSLNRMETFGCRGIHDLSRAGEAFNSILIVFGVTFISMIDQLHDHYIVCGYGRVGRAVAAEFQREGVPFVVMDEDAGKVEHAVRAGMLAAAADATRDQSLVDAGILRAKGLVAALGADEDNLFLTLSAKTLNPKLRLAARAAEEGSDEKLRRAGADMVFAPYAEAGHQLALGLLRPHVLHFLDVATKNVGLDVGLEQTRVGEGSEFVNKSLRQVQMRRELGVIVLAIRKANGQMIFNPPADAVLEGGDFLILMGEQHNLRRIEPLLTGVKA